jgi:hypothetical protein
MSEIAIFQQLQAFTLTIRSQRLQGVLPRLHSENSLSRNPPGIVPMSYSNKVWTFVVTLLDRGLCSAVLRKTRGEVVSVMAMFVRRDKPA